MFYIDRDELQNETQAFLNSNESKYFELVQKVKHYLTNSLEECDVNTPAIAKIYSRGDLLNPNVEIKSCQRIVDKLIKFKTEEHTSWKNKSAIEIHDIVACRVVVYYRYQINIAALSILSTCEQNGFKKTYEEYKNQYGYHAHHLILTAIRPNHLRKLLCEIQVKTVLHDAWGSRTHSFIYKSSGRVSPSIRLVMEGIGDSLESIERQTDYLRQSFDRELDIEKRLRSAARVAMLYRLETKVFPSEELTNIYRQVYYDIMKHADKVTKSGKDDDFVSQLLDNISFVKDRADGTEAAFNLILLLCSIKEQNDLNYLCLYYLNDFLDAEKANEVDKLFWKTSVLYVVGERETSVSILRQAHKMQPLDFSDGIGWRLGFNLLNYVIESVMQGVSDPALVRGECDKLIENLKLSALEAKDSNYCSAQDTMGAYWIAFGSTESEIEKGIALCRNAYEEGSTNKAGVAFQRLHERIGWTRILKNDPI